MAGIISNIIQNSLSGFAAGAITTVGGYAGDALSGVGNYIDAKGQAVGDGKFLSNFLYSQQWRFTNALVKELPKSSTAGARV
jgi:hypothetical protein